MFYLGIKIGGNIWGNVEKRSLRQPPQPSFPLAEERVVKRSDDRVSKYTSGIDANALACVYSPSPTMLGTTLVDPLFACGGKRVTALLQGFTPVAIGKTNAIVKSIFPICKMSFQ